MLWIRRLTFALLLISGVALGEIPSFPPDLCQSLWNGKTSEDFLYDFQKDPRSFPDHLAAGNTDNYYAYVDRLTRNGLDRKKCHKTWTVLIYMVATPNLLPYAYADLNEMEATLGTNDFPPGSSIRTDVLVQFDAGTSQNIRRLHMFPNPEEIYEPLSPESLRLLTEEKIRSPVASVFDKIFPQNEKERLKNFLNWGTQEYPSEHYLVLIWGHGQGWTALSSEDPKSSQDPHFGGIAIGASKTFLDIPSLRGVLGEIHGSTGNKIDVFASDACLMQSVENLTEIADHTHFVCGSEDLQSFAGFPYGILLSQLNSGRFEGMQDKVSSGSLTEDEARLVAWVIPKLYQESFSSQGSQRKLDPNAWKTLTESTVSSVELSTVLLPHLNQLGALLLQFIEEKPIRFMFLKGLIENGQTFQDRTQDSGTQDLGLFLKGLSESLERNIESEETASPATLKVLEELPLLREALNQTIVNSILGDKYPKFNPNKSYGPCGISIWLPRTNEEFQKRIEDFSRSIFYGSGARGEISGWHAFMLKMYP